MVSHLLQKLRIGVRRSASLHAMLDSMQVLKAGKWVYERSLLRRGYLDTVIMGQSLRLAITSRREISRIETFNEQAFVQQMLDSLRPGDVIWDVGANIGMISLLLARRAAELGASIHAFEPEPRNFSELVRNIGLNGFEKVITAHHLALSDGDGEATLFVNGEVGEGRHSILTPFSDVSMRVTVPMASARTFISQTDYRPNVVKIDVEGAEIRVLHGMQSTLLAAGVRELLLEIHPFQGGDGESNAERVMKFVTRSGFEPITLVNRGTEIHAHYRRR